METKDNEIFEMPEKKKKASNFYFQKGINDLLPDSRIWMKNKKSLQNLDNKVCKADESASNMEKKKIWKEMFRREMKTLEKNHRNAANENINGSKKQKHRGESIINYLIPHPGDNISWGPTWLNSPMLGGKDED